MTATGRRAAISVLFVALAVAVTTLGVTWAGDDAPPRLVQDTPGPLFDDVALTVGQPVTRCATVRPERGSLTALDFDGTASGSLSSAVNIRISRGLGSEADPSGCHAFVPVNEVYDGPLDQLPPATSRLTSAVDLASGSAIAYRATLDLARPATGSTTISLRVTGVFADRATPPPPASDVIEDPTAPPCLQRQTARTVATAVVRRDGRRLEVRVPASLPVTLVRALPVYVRADDETPSTSGSVGRRTASGSPRPMVRVGSVSIRPRRTSGGRWRALVPLARLADHPDVVVTSGALRATVSVVTRPCAVRLRVFSRSDGRVDLRIDAHRAISGAALRLPVSIGTVAGGRILTRYSDARGRALVAVGPLGRTGRSSSTALPRVRFEGRTVELTNVPAGTGSIRLRLTRRGAPAPPVPTCRPGVAVTGTVVTDARRPVRQRITAPGDRCRR